MSKTTEDLRRLRPVLEAAYQAEQLKMARINNRISDLSAKLARLDAGARVSETGITPAHRVGADLRWQAWAEDRKRRINSELAKAFAARAAARDAMVAALSKREAVKAMELEAQRDDRRRAERRISW